MTRMHQPVQKMILRRRILQQKSRHPSYKKHILLQKAFVPSNIMMSTTFKNTITDVVLTNTAQSRQARLQALVDAGTSGLTVHTADSDGVVVILLTVMNH